MTQRWEDLLFAHWSLSPARLLPLIPPGLTLDTFRGMAWLGITPFRVAQLRVRGLPAVPGLSSFAEINVRTYVTVGGTAGVYFFSLDASSAWAVVGARWGYRLPYFRAAFSVERRENRIIFASRRQHPSTPAVEFRADYGPVGPVARAAAGSLAWWLTERYCLYTVDRRGRISRADIDHEPWPLQPAEATLQRNTMTAPLNLVLPLRPEHLHFAARLDVRVWPPVSVTSHPVATRPFPKERQQWTGQSSV